VRKLIAVLVLSIVITGMAFAPPEPLEPPLVSIGELSMEDVAVVQSASVERSYALVITMEQSDVNVNPALVGVSNDALYHNGSPAGCNPQHGTDSPLLLSADTYDLYHGGMIPTLIRLTETTAYRSGVPEVTGPIWPSRCRAGWGALT